jgi:hypothetical protein
VADYIVIKQTIPPNTPQSKPVEISVDVNEAVVAYMGALFPKNCAMLVGVQLCDHQGRFWPSQNSPTAWYTGDNCVIDSHSPFPLRGDGPHTIIARMYNEDNTFERTPQIRFDVEAAPKQ